MVTVNSIRCNCGGYYIENNKANYAKHIKSKKHQIFLETGEIAVSFFTRIPEEEKIAKRREYLKEYYKNNKQVWQNTPSYNNYKKLKIDAQVEVVK